MTKIPLYLGRTDASHRHEVIAYALIDDADAAWAHRFTWHVDVNGYAVRRLARPDRRRSLMHRELLGLIFGDARLGDHINRNRLDNRRSNLRIVDRQQHNHNLSSHHDATSSFRGVSWDKRKNKWRATAQLQYRHYFLGYFEDEREASAVVGEWRAQHMSHSEEAALA